MNNLFEQTVSIIEHEFYDSKFLAGRWQHIKDAHAQQYNQAESVEAKEKVLESLLESLDVSHSMLIDSQLAEAIEKQNDVFAQDGIILEMQEDTLFAQVLSFQVCSMHKKDVGRLATFASSASAIILDLRLNGGGSV